MSHSPPWTLRPATCCTMSWSGSGRRPGVPSSSSPITCARPLGWETGLQSLPSDRAASSESSRWTSLAPVRLKIRPSPIVQRKSSTTCGKRSTRAWSLGTGGAPPHLAALPVSSTAGGSGVPVGGICRSQLLDRDRRQHEAHRCGLCPLGRYRSAAWIVDGHERVPGANVGRADGESAEPAQHLLAADRNTLVRALGEGNSLCDCYGLCALGDDQHGDRTQTDAEDLCDGGAQPGRTRAEAVSVCAVSRQPSLCAYRAKTGMGVRLALTDCGRNDLRQPGAGSAADDGP